MTNKHSSFLLIKRVIDGAVQKGLFQSAADVIAVCQALENLKPDGLQTAGELAKGDTK